MGKISKRYLHRAIEERIYEVFWEQMADLQHPHEVQEFLENTEHLMLAKRLAIAILLLRGYDYAYIDDALKVSQATIATVHRQLESGASGFKKAVNLANKRRKSGELWDSLEEILLKISPPAAYGSTRYLIKSHFGKELYKRKLKRSVL